MKLIDCITLTYNGLFAKGTKQRIHLHQGEMDGACAVYSLMMALITTKAIKRDDIMPETKHAARFAKGRLVSTFLERNGLVREGYDLYELYEDFNKASRKLAKLDYFSIFDDAYPSDTGFVGRVMEELDDNHPVILGFSYTHNSGHVVLAIGYNETKQGIQFFCLDPSHRLAKGQYWNNIVTFVDGDSKKNGESLRDSYDETCLVNIDEAISVKSYR